MGLKRPYIEVHERYNGQIYTFDSDFVLSLMEAPIYTSITIVRQIESLIDQDYLTDRFSFYELAGVVKGESPLYYRLGIRYEEYPIFESIEQIEVDDYLDYYNLNLVVTKFQND